MNLIPLSGDGVVGHSLDFLLGEVGEEAHV